MARAKIPKITPIIPFQGRSGGGLFSVPGTKGAGGGGTGGAAEDEELEPN
ncbi:MAG: hypothetical protein QF775_01475 [archaeon]|nr:hypothetical protein [archaeon]